MIRSVWSGTLSFGLVAIPVKLYPATEPKDVRFHLVEAESGRRIRYRRVVEGAGSPVTHPVPDTDVGPQTRAGIGSNSEPILPSPTRPDEDGGPDGDDEHEVPFESLARGIEVEPGVLVTLTPEEIRAVQPTPSRTIEIEDFVELDAIDPVFFEKSYVVAPQAGGAERPYALLLRALERAGRVGIGRFVLRTKPHLVGIRPRAGAIGLETLFFGDEVRDPSEIVRGVDAVAIGEREIAMAEQLIAMLSTDWDPSRYADTYREELRALISGKAPMPEPETVAVAASSGPSDAERLMDALQQSVERAKRRSAKPRMSGRRSGEARTG